MISSSQISQPRFPTFHTTQSAHALCLSTLNTSLESNSDTDYVLFDDDYIQQAAAFRLQDRHCMNQQYYTTQPQLRVEEAYTPDALPPPAFDARHDSLISGAASDGDVWSMYQPGMSLPAHPAQRPWKRARIHQRTPSASTVASNGPASPYTNTNTNHALYPQIANTDYSPNSPAQAAYADQALFSKNLPTPSHTPTDAAFYAPYISSQLAHTQNAHWAMSNVVDDFAQEYYPSSRQSMSSHDSPATPQSGMGENYDAKQYTSTNEFRPANLNVQLYRTESQAYQDELYNPPTVYTSTPVPATKRQQDLLSPHRNMINERIQTANLARTASPTSAISRDRSPFRDGSPLAPTADWNPSPAVGSAANMRQQQREEAAEVEYAQHRPALQREPTKTISPKDALLEYSESEQPSLFQDNIPVGYRQHNGSTGTWQNGFVSQPDATFGNFVATGATSQMQPFRQASADTSNEAKFGYMSLPPSSQQEQASQIQPISYQQTNYAVPKINYADTNPEFPAQLTSMESSISEGGPPVSSQESFNPTSAPQRPSDTRAHTGTYTCTYHGCAQRFESHASLQKHKKDFHRAQCRENTSDDNTGSTTSPRSTESPVPAGQGMTSAAIQARNSQAGPHKCTRINPSTNKPCNTIFSRPYDLTRHEETIHNGRKTKVRCPMCREEKTFSRNDALTRHMRVVHPEVETFGKRGRRAD